MNVLDKILELRKLINDANYQYHTLDKPTMSDFKYDQLMHELIDLETQYPEYDDEGSPSKKVGGVVLDGFNKFKHTVPMMSLGNVFNFDELASFVDRIEKVTDEATFLTELKIDGLAVTLIYEQGKFKKAATRGNGQIGEDITLNAKTIKSLPLELKEPIDIEVRGEIYMSHQAFKKSNEERLEKGLELFANPRNAAAGTIRQLDTKVTAKRDLSLFTYAIVNAPSYVSTQKEVLELLKKLGFPVNPNDKQARDIHELKQNIEIYDDLRKTLPYDTDGVVIKVNELRLYDFIGTTAKAPKYATAYKFEAEKQQTTINDIVFQVGRTGVITPVAELEPVFISGSLVSRATLHNEDYIKSKDIRVGDTVWVHKAGEIIPEVISVDLDKRTHQQPFEMISLCPVCGSLLVRKEGEADYYCQNPECSGKNIFALIHFASRVAMDIDTLGEKVVETLHDQTFLQTIPDIYKLNQYKSSIMELPGFGDKKVQKILDAIEKSKQQPLDRLLFGLGIKHVGAKVAKTLLKAYPSINQLKQATYEDLIQIPDIGPEIAQSVENYFSQHKQLEMLDELKSLGLNLTYHQDEVKPHEFNGKIFVITGTLQGYSRDQASALIEKLGGKVTSSVSAKTNILLAGSDAGSKLKKAIELGVYVMNEEEFKVKTDE